MNARETRNCQGKRYSLPVNERQISAVAYVDGSVVFTPGVNGKPPDVISLDSGQDPSELDGSGIEPSALSAQR